MSLFWSLYVITVFSLLFDLLGFVFISFDVEIDSSTEGMTTLDFVLFDILGVVYII